MDFIKGLWRDLRARPVDTLVRWQEQRFLWLLMAIAMGGLIILAHSFFQIYLYMAPCEQCVYIRYAMFVMVIGGVIAAINPKNIVLKLIGCIAAFYGSIMGIKFSIKLNGIHHAVHNADPDSLFGVQGCSTDPTFPFNLPLAEWAPEWFKPTGDGTVAKLAMRQPFVLFKGLTFQKLCLPGAFRPGDHHNKMLRPG
ncbi:protein-disulfide oxidoreductase DsbI, partial [Salmonella enterica]|uniref:protein-disulfide oxidoreductase DsbI n=1 Tax=Salmonella enterica TaxID=28901 RepID=UPI003AF32186